MKLPSLGTSHLAAKEGKVLMIRVESRCSGRRASVAEEISFHLLAHRASRHEKFPRGFLEAQVAGGGLKGTQCIEGWQGIIHSYR